MKNYIKLIISMSLLFYLNNPLIQAKETKKVMMKEIVKLEEENRKLDAWIVKEIKFKLAKEQNVGGNTEKYILEGNEGNKWIFKIYSSSSAVKSSRVLYRLSSFFGTKTPPVYEIKLLINKKLEYGSLQKMLQDIKVWKSSFLANISPEQIISFQKQQVLDRLIYKEKVERKEFLLDTKNGGIIPVDRAEVFCGECLSGKDLDLVWYSKFFSELLKNDIKINYTDVFMMIDYIQSIDDKLIRNIFEDVCGQNTDYYWKKFLLKKHNLRRDFEKFYQELSIITGKNIEIPIKKTESDYTIMVLENIKKEILSKKYTLEQMKSNIIEKQEKIKVISSKDAWYLIYSKLKYASKEDFLLRVEEINRKLEKLKDEALTIYEKCAINLYINQIEKIKIFYETGKNSKQNLVKRITLHPVSNKAVDIEYQRTNCSRGQIKNSNKYDEKILIDKILNAFKESEKLDKKIVKKIRFKLCENQYLKGSTQKYLFKGNSGDIWLFKNYHLPKKVKISRSIYLLAQLLGIYTPEVYEISLPINGKLVYGAIQKFIIGALEISGEMIDKLDAGQIREVQNHWVFDWLIFNADPSSDHFLIEPNTKEIIAIDKDSCLGRGMERISPDENPWEKAHYSKFWKAHEKNKINIDFNETFDFINYIQSINEDELRRILSLALNKDELMDKFFLRRRNLGTHFDKLYHKLSLLRGEQFQKAEKRDKEAYLRLVLGKIKNIVLEKKLFIKNLKGQKRTRQNNIVLVSSREAWFIVDKLNNSLRSDFSLDIERIMDELKCLEGRASNICEKLAINLYMEEIRRICKERDIENFLQRGIEFISLHPKQITNKKISNIEYIFRTTYEKNKESSSAYKNKLKINDADILSHLEYIRYPRRIDEKEGNRVLKDYESWIDKNPENLMYKIFYGLLVNDVNYLKKINNSFPLKCFGMALIWSFEEDRDEVIKYCNKAIVLNEGNHVAYWSYMLLGLIYEYGAGWNRFGESFELEKSIIAYENALKINLESFKAHLNLAALYLIREEPDKALNQFNKADKLDSKYGEEHFHFDKIKRRNLYENKKKYLEAIKMNTISGRHHYVLGLACFVKGDKKIAKYHFNKAKEFGYKVNVNLE